MQTKEQVLQNCTVEGMVVKLPSVQLDRKLYTDVAKSLELIGGKWKGGKVSGFVFNEDPTELLADVSNGEKRNLKKEFQFFPTPDEIADWLVELADLKGSERVLEPSAGQGAIIKAINRKHPKMMIECFELMPLNEKFLNKIPTAIVIGNDFLEADEPEGFDKIIANPPFSKNQDIDHIEKMWSVLRPGGRIVSVASKHWQLSKNKKEKQFREFVEKNGHVQEIESGAFKDSGTMVASCVIVLDKPSPF